MKKFKQLTSYIPKIKAFPDARVIWDFERDVHTFVEKNPDLVLYNYREILENLNIEYDGKAIKAADYKTMDAQGVAALIVTVVRTERFCEGTIEQFIQNGCVSKWLERLKEIDE